MWNAGRWLFSFVLSLILAYASTRWLETRLGLAAQGSLACVVTSSLFIVGGLALYGIFPSRGWFENYSSLSNKPLHRTIVRYLNPKANTALLSRIYPRYIVGDRPYFLVWYLPGVRLPSPNLSGGAEPLLFNSEGHWIDDEALFHKLALMWTVALFICPGNPLDKSLVNTVNRLKQMAQSHLASLPGLLAVNADAFRRQGLGDDLGLVQAAYEAKCDWWRNTIRAGERKIEWANAHGWDGMPEMRYEDIRPFYDAYAQLVEAGRRFVARHRLAEAEQAALRLSGAVSGRKGISGGWTSRRALDAALQKFAAPFSPGEIDFRRVDGEWRAPEIMLAAYRSRVAYARQVDAEKGISMAAPSGAAK